MKFETVLITGASDGLGKALAIDFSHQDVQNIVICGRNNDKLQIVANEIRKNGKNVYTAAFDLTDLSATKRFIDDVNVRFKGIDCLINNAGANTTKATIDNLNIDDFQSMLLLNSVAPTLLIQNVLPYMRQQKFGFIINILSTVCLHDIPEFCGYSAAKHAFKSINDTTRKIVKDDNINVLAVYPGGMQTNFRNEERPLYLKPEEVSRIIIKNLEIAENTLIQEILVRPIAENNY